MLEESVVCDWCGGRGHPAEKCSTPTVLKAQMKFHDVAWNFGAMKGCCWDPNTPEEELRQLKKAVGGLKAWRKKNGFKAKLF